MIANTKKMTMGDFAVDGLLGGLVAGLAMAFYLLISGLLTGHRLADLFSSFSAGESTTPLRGALTHLAVSAIYGALFGVASIGLRRWPISLKLLGGLYGLFLFLIARFAVLPGLESTLLTFSIFHFAVAHLIYGGVLGRQLER